MLGLEAEWRAQTNLLTMVAPQELNFSTPAKVSQIRLLLLIRISIQLLYTFSAKRGEFIKLPVSNWNRKRQNMSERILNKAIAQFTFPTTPLFDSFL